MRTHHASIIFFSASFFAESPLPHLEFEFITEATSLPIEDYIASGVGFDWSAWPPSPRSLQQQEEKEEEEHIQNQQPSAITNVAQTSEPARASARPSGNLGKSGPDAAPYNYNQRRREVRRQRL